MFWPLVSSAMEQVVKERVLPEVRAKLPSFLQSMDIQPCTLGKTPAKVIDLRVLPNGHTGALLDLVVDIEYIGDADIKFVFQGASLGVREVKFAARLFLSLHHLLPEPPFLQGASVHMASPCRLSMDWTGVADFLDYAFFEDVIHTVVNDALKDLLVLPARIPVLFDSAHRMNIFDMVRPRPQGCLQVTVLGASGLVGNEYELKTLLTGELTTDLLLFRPLRRDQHRGHDVEVGLGAEHHRASLGGGRITPISSSWTPPRSRRRCT
ncbi:unnamed protein product [Prorocentrum cordatum]|uniref:SMP-LTD domain-containing protein n=1 Tax=Prorocentrum cordatum TaxID=2364126 RepID=A0ABN9WLA9_9DINO|nr:unnamed protein product [Polarella glacialis]